MVDSDAIYLLIGCRYFDDKDFDKLSKAAGEQDIDLAYPDPEPLATPYTKLIPVALERT